MSKFLYAFDLSLSNTGIAIFDLHTKELVHLSSVSTKDKDSHGVRLKQIADHVLLLVKEYPPEIIVIERGFSRFNNATQAIFRVHGLINYLFYEYKQVYYTPKAIKSEIVDGNATKAQVQKRILQSYPRVEFQDEDQSDAFAIGLTHLIKNGIIAWNKTIKTKSKKKK